MTDVLRHRGPDAEGHVFDGPCALGHRRLKIVDLSDRAAQPMWDHDGTLVVSFNGEIYNFRDLRATLEARYPFTSASDTEVIVHGYREWGVDLFRRLNGMFAIALWDRTSRTLVLARDRLGKKPLFYYWDGTLCVFGSSLAAIAQHPSVRRIVDEQSLAQYFAFGYVPTPRSIYRDTFKVRQGAYVRFAKGQHFERLYWDLPDETGECPEERALEELDALVHDSVARRLQSDVPLVFFLSGGVDSTLITAVARKQGEDVQAVTVGFSHPDYDESPAARRIAAHLGVRHIERRVSERQLVAGLANLPALLDEPFADSSLLPTYCVSAAARETATVALSGDGGDELFCGYPKYRDLQRGLTAMRLPLWLREAGAAVAVGLPFDRVAKSASAIRGDARDLVRWLVSVWKPVELTDLMGDVTVTWAETEFDRTLSRFAHRSPLEALMAADVRSYLCDDILQKVDRASMAVSLELRSPLLDYRIVEFASRLPLGLKWRGRETKYLLKRLLDRYVPRSLWARPKQGFKAPIRELYRSNADDVRSSIDRLATTFDRWLRPAVMRRLLDEHVSGRRDYSQKLYSLDVLSRWCEKHV
jgi:asparagine synthase (glutamine-hydrolysing)